MNRMKLISQILNLKPHYIKGWRQKEKTLVLTAVDW